MIKRKPLVMAILIPVLVGTSGLVHLLSQPRFENIPAIVVVQLTGSGLCFGIALGALIALIRAKREA